MWMGKPKSRKVLICGDRHWSDYSLIFDVISNLHSMFDESMIIIHGAAPGADTIAAKVADDLGILTKSFPAYWNCNVYEKDTGNQCKTDDKHAVVHGRPAGVIRNARMIKEGNPDIVLGFHRDIMSSKGTRDMLQKAEVRKIRNALITEWADFIKFLNFWNNRDLPI